MIRVLLVDDDPDILELVKEELEEQREIQVGSCTSASDALKILSQDRYDAVISDLRMSGMDGITFFRTIRVLYPDTIFILYSGGECDDRVRSASEEGLEFFIHRSGDLEGEVSALLSILQKSLGKSSEPPHFG